MNRRRVAILAGIGAAAIALTLGAVLTRSTDQGTANAAALDDMTSYVATTSGSDDGTRADMRSQIGDLMANDDFRDDVRALRDRQQDAMDNWWDKYGEDRDSEAAHEAKQTLRDDAVSDVEKLAEKYGVELPDGLRGFLGKRGGSMGGGGHMGPGGHRGGGFMPPAEGPNPGAEESAANLSI